ncbi:MAG: hypothetical protein NTW30_05635 [Candidatus Aenigmarchaeota archaeon]|nr:hypothetical protein [Candidatus Aenigmarchaeota archaeon]
MEEKEEQLFYNPTEAEVDARKRVYNDFSVMRDIRNQRYKYFNDRTLKEFIDDSELRLSNYVPTRASQGKEEWQANFSHPVTSNKMHAILAGVALDVPDTRITAKNEGSIKSAQRAYVMKNLVKHSYDKDNKEEQIYNEAFECAAKGTVIVADVYVKQKAKRKEVTKFDPITGVIEFEEEEVITKDEINNFIIPLENFYVWNMYIPTIQDQPKVIWAEQMGKEEFKAQFNNFPNYKFVKKAPKILNKELESRYFFEGWASRVKGYGSVEVVKFYDRFKDNHVILANGVVLFDGPILLGKKKKWYPFAKTIHAMFSVDFFYGNSLPNKLMGEQDVTNSLYNMAIDKTYKSMVPSLLIGNTNKDDFDLEDPYISLDTKIYVQDINQVKEMPTSGISNADVKIMDMVSRGMDLTSVDANQQGVAGRGVTAREIVIANENARKLKGVFYMFLTALWIQKMKLRIMNILTFYTDLEVKNQLNEQANDKDNKLDTFKKFMVENADLGDGTKGTLGIKIVGSPEELPTQEELDSNSKKISKETKENYKEIAITSDYLDNWEYDVKVVSESIFQKESSLSQAKMEGKLQIMGQAFPEYFQQNKEKIFKQFMIAYDDDPDEYDTTPPPPLPAPGASPESPGQPQQQGAQTLNNPTAPKEPIQTGA